MLKRYFSWLLVFCTVFGKFVVSVEEEEDQPLRILVKYRHDEFLQELQEKYAIERRFNINIAKKRIVSITIKNRKILEKIRELIDNVDFAEEDNPMSIVRGENYRISDLQHEEVQVREERKAIRRLNRFGFC